jgi:hypothetical protein
MGHQDHSDHSQLPLMKTVSRENEDVESPGAATNHM